MKKIKLKLATQLSVLVTTLGMTSAVSATELLNLVTNDVGMHRISYESLLAQGADLSGVTIRRIGLSVDGEPVVYQVYFYNSFQ